MPYVTSIERLAREEGQVEAIQEGIAKYLKVRFGAPGKRVASKMPKITDLDELWALFEAILKSDTLADVRQLLPQS